ncbi:hypothetical protein GGI21_001227 [Coemansia aciculifera]|uniref:Uncharacterized protein n=1 Tax=Coemansia aciculifera TaxID=417176 RepID=A0ACC1M855_9FUNG|nr:hypothetical protein IWW38_000996 [Coemansia aciculifera]KAJ2910085.1 hypothetical protein GGI21_001227 [Coemansia aciculifera]
MAIHNLFVPRARIASFNVQLRVEDLNNVPPLNGLFYVKWKLQDYSGSTSSGPDGYDVPPLDRSMVLTDLNDMITNEGSARGGRENSSMGNSLPSKQHSTARNNRKPATSASSVHSATTRSNTTETSQSRALLPIDNTNVRELAPFQRSSKKNQQIIDDIFLSPTLPT